MGRLGREAWLEDLVGRLGLRLGEAWLEDFGRLGGALVGRLGWKTWL